jgi:hypothetical protein
MSEQKPKKTVSKKTVAIVAVSFVCGIAAMEGLQDYWDAQNEQKQDQQQVQSAFKAGEVAEHKIDETNKAN